MAVMYALWVPVFVFAHILALGLFAYGLEHLNGSASACWRRLGRLFKCLSQVPAHDHKPQSWTAPALEHEVPASTADHDSKEWYGNKAALTDSDSGSISVLSESGEGSSQIFESNRDDDVHGFRPAPAHACHLEHASYPVAWALPDSSVKISWYSLSCSVMDRVSLQKKQLLWPCSGCASPGELHALLGPSGAGKSTLLNMLAMRKSVGKLGGQVLMNGHRAGKGYAHKIAVVDQDDVFVPTLTAVEVLRFHASLKLRNITVQAMQQRLLQVMACMGLSQCSQTQVGGTLPGGILVPGLSGGERRRLTIACALVGSPVVLYLDEPTSGLDSFAAMRVMTHVRQLCLSNHTIIATIHQPREQIWNLLHKVTVLSEGYQVYTGNVEEVVEWFAGLHYHYKPGRNGAVSDWVIDLVSTGYRKSHSLRRQSMTCVDDIREAAHCFAERQHGYYDEDLYHASHNYLSHTAAVAQAKQQSYQVGFYTQFKVLFKRSMHSQLRNPADSAARLMLSLWCGALSGIAFWNVQLEPGSTYQVLSALHTGLMMFGLLPFSYMSFFSADRHQYYKDQSAHLYSPLAYHVATSLAGLPGISVNALMGSLTLYGMAGLQCNAASIISYAGVNVLQACIAIQMLIACIFITPTQDMAYILATGYTAMPVLFAGLLIRLSDYKLVPLQWISYISYSKYAMNGLAHEQYGLLTFARPGLIITGLPGSSQSLINKAQQDAEQVSQSLAAGFKPVIISSGTQVLEYWDYTIPTNRVIGILMCIYAIFLILSYIGMRFLHCHRY